MENRRNERMQSAIFSLSAGLAALLIIGCATIISGTRQKIGVSTTPPGATVAVDNENKGQTPVVLKLARSSNHTVKISMPGYQPFETTLTRKINGWFWGNLALGGIIGIIVDVTDGAMYRLKPGENITLQKQDLADEKDVMTIVTVLNAEPSWEQIGNLVPADSQGASAPAPTTAPATAPPAASTVTPPTATDQTSTTQTTSAQSAPTANPSAQPPGVVPLNSSAGIVVSPPPSTTGGTTGNE